MYLSKANEIKYICKYISGLMGMIISCVLILISGCSDEKINEPNSSGEKTDGKTFYLSVNLSCPSTLVTRSSTESDGTSDYDKTEDGEEERKDTFDGFQRENVVYPLYLYFFSYEDYLNDYGETITGEKYLFTKEYRKVIDFNLSNLQPISIRIELSPEEVKQLAEKNCIRVYASGNIYYDDHINISSWYKDKSFISFDAKYNLNEITGSVNEDSSFLLDFPSKEESQKEIDYTTTMNGSNIPVLNSELIELNFEKLKSVDIEEYIAKMNFNFDLTELTARINTNLNECFNKEIEFERMLARVDFRDRSPNGTLLYPLKNKDAVCPFQVKLVAMTPINVSRRSYLFRHTATGDNLGGLYDAGEEGNPGSGFNISMFGIENGNASSSTEYNWIADADWEFKRDKAENWNSSDLQNYFYNIPDTDISMMDPNNNYNHLDPFIGQIGHGLGYNRGFKAMKMEEFFSDSYWTYTAEGNTYYPWRYFTENTLPSTDAMIRGLSTGIAFTTLLCDNNGKPIPQIPGDTFKDFITYEERDGEHYIIIKYDGKEVECKWETNVVYPHWRPYIYFGDYIEPDQHHISEGYHLTYFYFFRHNNNNDPNVTGPMEYGIVRNNIYRIAVAGFNGLPTPYNPEDPDEPTPENQCIAVDLKVLAWAKHDINVSL